MYLLKKKNIIMHHQKRNKSEKIKQNISTLKVQIVSTDGESKSYAAFASLNQPASQSGRQAGKQLVTCTYLRAAWLAVEIFSLLFVWAL